METPPEPAVWLPTIRANTGADVFTTRLCSALNAAGIRAEITWLPHRAEVMPWTVAALPPPAWANVAHVNSWLPQRFWPRHLPIVVTVHHLVHDPAYAPYRSAAQAIYHRSIILPRERAAIHDAAAVTTVSEYVRGTVIEFAGRDDTLSIPNWVDSTRFIPIPTASERVPPPFRLLIAGSASRRKGIDLLPSFAAALGTGFQIRFAGSDTPNILGPGNVVMLGRISDEALLHEYQHCDAVVSLSRYEGFGYTALEAMACGKPFFGFDGSGLAEVMRHNSHCLAPLEDVVGLATRCRNLLADHQLTRQICMQGRVQATTHFSEHTAIRSYLDTYRMAMSINR
ncbi:glycosyltransferase family 4 protein [Stenotrophomonas ginsengisoli]|uniref:glycosyltransferase family 4 protein n=1 Tax=Stenotrophomonas ginsengisoli TaxID=336566 RepID=UPI00070AB8AE|nr:glycosyltransferase family 4 protein [Stenotrophomonas ginsengisoli]